MENEVVVDNAQESTPVVSFDKLTGNEPKVVEPQVEVAKTEVVETDKEVAPIEVASTEKKYWDDEYKTHFGEESVEQIKEYKTKYEQTEQKIKEYEDKLKENEFANENIKKINELAKNGIEITEETVAFLNKDYSKITDPLKLIEAYVKNQNPEWSDKKIKFEISKQYGLDQIKQGVDEDGDPIELTADQKELKEIIDEDIDRQSKVALQKLQEKQDELRLFKPQVKSQEEIQQEKNEILEGEKKWSETTNKISSQNQNIKVNFTKDTNTIINGKPVELAPIEYSLSKEDKAEADSIFKSMGGLSPDDAPFLAQFADKDGHVSNDESRAKIYQFCQEVVASQKIKDYIAVSAYKRGFEDSVRSDKKVGELSAQTLPNSKVSLGTVSFDSLTKNIRQ